MISKLSFVYKQSGAKGLALRAVSSTFRKAGSWMERCADRLDARAVGAMSRENWELLSRNHAFKNLHRGRRCFVIGNGPSLVAQDLSPLAREITFVMNAFWKHPILEQWQPTYYALCDPLYFDNSETMREFFRSLRASVVDSTFWVTLSNAVRDQGLLPLDRTHYVGFRGDLDDRKLLEIDLTKYVPHVQSVSQLCIMLAIYMGCSPIYLLGLDHDWLAHRGADRHFYVGNAGLEKHPKVLSTLAQSHYKTDMECQLKLWNGYETLLDLATRRGIRILNATNGGFLDVFERVEYEAVLERDNPRAITEQRLARRQPISNEPSFGCD